MKLLCFIADSEVHGLIGGSSFHPVTYVEGIEIGSVRLLIGVVSLFSGLG